MTVGLSFGSAFSGEGINVSSTVSSILVNLQNVETPWKNQISKLNTQDTALSSLGTILSSMSTDMSALTEANGILAEKTGSSSNTSALTLTSASSSAVAGTHTVVISSLATTSSGVLTKINSSSDTISGSIVIQVGSGTAQTITVGSSSNTLSGLASTINSSGMGVTASVLTDASGSRLSLVSGTSGSNGVLSVTSAITDTTSSTSLSYTGSVTGANGTITVDGVELSVASNTVTNLIPGVTFQLLATTASTSPVQVVIANYNTGVESVVEALVTNYNSLLSAINTQEGYDSAGNAEPLFGNPTLSMLQQDILSGINATNPNGHLDSISTTSGATISGSMTIKVGTGSVQTISLSSSQNSISSLADAINSADIGVTAAVVTKNNAATLTLSSQYAGSNGALTVVSNIKSATPNALSYTDSNTDSTSSSGLLGSLTTTTDKLGGSLTIQVGDGTVHTISLTSSGNTLSGLATTINSANVGVTASVVTSNGTSSLKLVSNTAGTDGDLSVSSGVYDLSNTTSKTVSYNFSSNVTSMSMMGISINNDGTISFDATSLDNLLNSDFAGVQNFFQSAFGWGVSFNTMLDNVGSSSSTGMIKLAINSNSSIISNLNADISREDMLISSESKSLTTEMNSVNEILTALPSQISQVNELYSAISGYNKSSS